MREKIKTFVALHVILLLYSVSAVFSKLAATETRINARFIVCYGIAVFLLCVYAVVWQQNIKRLPLPTAFASKAVTVVWDVIWGVSTRRSPPAR